MNNNELKLIITGTKGGFDVLASNFSSSEYFAPEIKDSYKDIRGSITFLEKGLTTYAVEFTPKYAVYTIYKALGEPDGSRQGTYVAINLYVPHNKEIDSPIELLIGLMNRYEDKYVDKAYSNMRPVRENIEDFYDILNSAVLKNRQRKVSGSSRQNGVIGYYFFNSLQEIKEIFSNPYRQEMYKYQEVMFIDMMNNFPNKINLKNNDFIDKVNLSKIEQGYFLTISTDIVNLKIDNDPYIQNSAKIVPNLTTIEVFEGSTIVITKSRPNYKNCDYSITVDDLVRTKYLKKGEEFNLTIPDNNWLPEMIDITITSTPEKVDTFTFKNKSNKNTYRSKFGKISIPKSEKPNLFSISVNESLIIDNVFFEDSNEYSIKNLNKIQFRIKNNDYAQVTVNNKKYDISSQNNVVYYDDSKPPSVQLNNKQYELSGSGKDYTIMKKETTINDGYRGGDIGKQNSGYPKTTTPTHLEPTPPQGNKFKKSLLLMGIGLLVGLGLGVLLGKWVWKKDKNQMDKPVIVDDNSNVVDQNDEKIKELKKTINELNDSIIKLNNSTPIINNSTEANNAGTITPAETTPTDVRSDKVKIYMKKSKETLKDEYFKESDQEKKKKIAEAIYRLQNIATRPNSFSIPTTELNTYINRLNQSKDPNEELEKK